MGTIRIESLRMRVTESFTKANEELVAGIVEEFSAFDHLRRHFLKPGECFTLPSGQCLGYGCMHDPLPLDDAQDF